MSGDGNTALIGGEIDNNNVGAAWVFTRSGSTWSQQGSKLVGTGAVGDRRAGQSVALSADGNTALIGGPSDDSNDGGGVGVHPLGLDLVPAGIEARRHRRGRRRPRRATSVALSGDGNTALIGGPN